ncbi:ras-specific guanine nucleotide-releasing factor RalGPS1-like [Oncorhynchus masou masou]|uniref:ras-specific guanine nucleotide-releasing factor RalGPS1-like n=1 Tax=Oncorhynchus masou masou TaxID=90313 RepID=UPI003183A407
MHGSPRMASSKEDLAGPSDVSASVRYNYRRPTCPDASVMVHMPTPPPSRHRKSHSLGNNMMAYGMVESKSATFPIEKPRHLLDDSFLESQSPARHDPHSMAISNGMSLAQEPSLQSLVRIQATSHPAVIGSPIAQHRLRSQPGRRHCK